MHLIRFVISGQRIHNKVNTKTGRNLPLSRRRSTAIIAVEILRPDISPVMRAD